MSPGLFELETGMLFRHLDGRGRQWSLPFLAKLSLTRWAQLQVGSNGYTTEWNDVPARYFDNVAVGVKLHALDQGATVPSLAFSAALSIPTVGDQLGYTSAYDALFIAYVTKDFGPVHADLNLGLNGFALGGSTVTQEWVALALSASLPPPFGVMVESYYFSEASPAAAKDGGTLVALSLTPRPWLVFDFGGDVGYFPNKRDYSSFVGMTIVPLVLWL